MNLRTHDRIHEPRWSVIARHARQAAQALTWRAYGHDVAIVFRDCTPARVVDLIGVHFHFTRDVDADRIANAQLARRHVEGLEQRPNPELEDALVLAMPYDIRESCETALAARRGRLSAPMVQPDDNAMEHFGQLVEQFGETLQQMAPIVADGRIAADDRHHIPEVRVKLRQLRGQLAALEAAMDRVMVKARIEYGRMQLRIDTECDTAWLLLENVNRDGEHWLTIASPAEPATPIGYLRLRPLATGSHTFEIAEVRPATGSLLRSPAECLG